MQITLPSSWYTREDIFALEREHIFLREWLCVARQEDIPATGDHRIIGVQGESIILLRNANGQLRAFYNVCRHRGARLCAADQNDNGRLKGGIRGNAITCPYHAWSYNLDGQLVRASRVPDELDFKREDIQLYPVAVDTWAGFIFIHLTPNQARPFTEHVDGVADRFQRYRMQDLRVGHHIQYVVNANWKLLCENYNECYHCGPVHPELCRIVPVFREQAGAGLDWDNGIPHREGARTFTTTGTTRRRTFPGLNDQEQNRHFGELLYPNMFLSLSSDHVVVFLLEPDGPTRSRVNCHFLFEPEAMAQADYDPSDATDFWDMINLQDWAICERVQQGVSSRVHEHGFCAPMEDLTLDIRNYVAERIGPYLPADISS